MRKLDSKHYDKHFCTLDFNTIVIQPYAKNEGFIQDFLITHAITQQNPIIAISPFVRSATCNLSLQAWEMLVERLAKKYPHFQFIIITYHANPPFHAMQPNVFIFNNNENLLNIVALLHITHLLIAPSTGISHIANNLKLSMIWLCSKRDRVIWCGDNMNENLFVILPANIKHITKDDEEIAIQQILALFEICSNTNGGGGGNYPHLCNV